MAHRTFRSRPTFNVDMRGRSGRMAIALLATLAVVAAPAAAAKAPATCGKVHVETSRGTVHARVNVRRGAVRCRTARRVARWILGRKGRFHPGDPGYYTVGGGWYGGMSTGRWDALNGHDALGGRAWGAIDT